MIQRSSTILKDIIVDAIWGRKVDNIFQIMTNSE
jgi:hypothetical protein